MSLQFEAADADAHLPLSDDVSHGQAMESLFTNLDGVIDDASRVRQLARRANDENAGSALDDAISLLHHVRSRLRYDLGPTT